MGRKLHVLVVDDEPVMRSSISRMLLSFDDIRIIGEAESCEAALALMEDQLVHIVFSDIQMEGGSGFELAEEIHSRYPDTLVVFLTGYASFALDGYKYGPVDFLVKPVSRNRLEQTLQRVKERLNHQDDRPVHIGIQTDEGYRILDVKKIAYLEKQERIVKIVGKDGSTVCTKKSMQEMEEILLDYGFFRCHQSYIIPLRDVESLHKETFGRSYAVHLRGSAVKFPLSRGKHGELREALQEMGIRYV